MARTAEVEQVDVINDEEGWEDVDSEAQIVFDTIGDRFVGTFVGWSESESKGIPQAHFVNDEGKFFVNCGWSLKQQLKDVAKGTLCRLIYVADQDTGQASPMMIFKVQIKRA